MTRTAPAAVSDPTAVTAAGRAVDRLGDYIAGVAPAGTDLGRGADGSAATFTVVDPATTRPLATVPDAGPAAATAAVDAATAAFPGWAATAPRERSELLHAAFREILAEADELAALIVAENGKALLDARAEVDYAAEFFRWFAEEAVRTEGGYGAAPAGGTRTIVTHRPVGVSALVTPWNFPAAMATRKIAPALAAGCTVVLKPAAETPLTAIAVARILARCGVPHGVVNLVPTTDAPGVVGRWLDDPRVRKISFTGSTPVGRALLRHAADRVVNASMELGGNAPFVVTDDADLDAAVQGALVAKFRNGGQACTAANRFYVHAAVLDEFVERFGAAISRLRVGPGADPSTQIGPLVSERARDGVARLVDDAVAAGARVTHRATLPEGLAGYFFPPTLLADVAPDAAILDEEVFGPVAPVVAWSDDADLLAMVNGTEMGLAGYVYSGDLHRALRLGEAMDVGMVGVNRGAVSDPSAPFGGMKQSGLGREGAREGLRAFQEVQYLSVDWS